MSLKKLLLVSGILIFPFLLFSQKTGFVNIGYEPNVLLFENSKQFIHSGSVALGYQKEKKNWYVSVGATLYKESLTEKCFEYQPDTVGLQTHPTVLLVEFDSCTWLTTRKAIEFPLTFGYVFLKKENTNFYGEFSYRPLFSSYQSIRTVDLAKNEETFEEDSNFKLRSWTKFSVHLGMAKKISQNLYLNTGLSLKSQDLDFDEIHLHIGADIRLQYRFGKKG